MDDMSMAEIKRRNFQLWDGGSVSFYASECFRQWFILVGGTSMIVWFVICTRHLYHSAG